MRRRLFVTAFALALLAPASTQARCRAVSLAQDAQESAFVVEAVVEQAGATARFRTTVVWKGGDSAPAGFELSARRGRAQWAWSESRAEGRTFLLFLRPTPSAGFQVMRCGATGEIDEPQRRALRDLGLRERGTE
ncbi:MAG: hypothetical protein AB8I08_08790 [Sandaracinaceae bacterium]